MQVCAVCLHMCIKPAPRHKFTCAHAYTRGGKEAKMCSFSALQNAIPTKCLFTSTHDHPERPGSEQGPCLGMCVCVWGGLPLVPATNTACMAATVCVCASMCLQTQKCVCTHSRGSTVTQQGHYLSPDWDEGNSIGFALRCGSHKDQETTFPPHFPHEYQRRGSTSATATATHKEKLQPYYFICITCNRHHIGRCIYCLISSSLAVNICWFISHRALPKHQT